jgi:hypothetical protein
MDITQHMTLTALWDEWGRTPPVIPPGGNRLFVRTIDTDPEEPGWDDWRIAGLVGVDGSLELIGGVDPNSPMADPIRESVAGGMRFGRVLIGGFGLEWGLFNGDGPTELRMMDKFSEDGGDRDLQ